MFFKEVISTLNEENIQYAIVGAYALALHGILRATVDIDLVIRLKEKDLSLTEKALNRIGLTSRLPIRASDIAQFRNEYVQNRNLIAWNFLDYRDPTRVVDILINTDLEDIEVISVKVGNTKVKVASLEELLKMKKLSSRPQDLIDIQKIQEKLNEK